VLAGTAPWLTSDNARDLLSREPSPASNRSRQLTAGMRLFSGCVAYEVRRVVTMTVTTRSNSTIDTGAQIARSAVLLVMMLRTTAMTA
jgi:hypothetical protein